MKEITNSHSVSLADRNPEVQAQQEPLPVIPVAIPPIPERQIQATQQGWGAKFYSFAAWGLTKVVTKLWCLATGYDTEAVNLKTKKNWEELEQLTGSPDFNQFILTILPKLNDKAFKEFKNSKGPWLEDAVDADEALIRQTIDATIINMMRNWAAQSTKGNPEMCVADMIGTLTNIVKEHLPEIQKRIDVLRSSTNFELLNQIRNKLNEVKGMDKAGQENGLLEIRNLLDGLKSNLSQEVLFTDLQNKIDILRTNGEIENIPMQPGFKELEDKIDELRFNQGIDSETRCVILKPLAEDLKALFFPKKHEDIIAPAPVNSWMYDAMSEFLMSKHLLDTFISYDTTDDQKKIAETEFGKIFLQYITQHEPINFKDMLPSQTIVKEYLNSVMLNQQVGVINWLGTQYEKVAQTDEFNIILNFALKYVESILIKTTTDVITNDDQLRELTTNFLKENRDKIAKLDNEKDALEIVTPFSEELLKLLGLENGKNITAPPIIKPFIWPLIQAHVPKALAKVILNPAFKNTSEWADVEKMNVVTVAAKVAEKSYFDMVKYNPDEVRKKMSQNLKELTGLTGSPHFRKFIEDMIPSDFVEKILKEKSGDLAAVVDFEKDNIRLSLEATIVNVVHNWALKSSKGNPEECIADMLADLSQILQTRMPEIQKALDENKSDTEILKPVVNDLMDLLFPNKENDVIAPSHVKKFVYDQMQKLLLSENVLGAFISFNTTANRKKLEQSEEGKLILECINALHNWVETIDFKSQWTELDLADLMPDADPWIVIQLHKILQSDSLNPVRNLLLKTAEGILINAAVNINAQEVMDLLMDFMKEESDALILVQKYSPEKKQKKLLKLFTPLSEKFAGLLTNNLVIPANTKPLILPFIKAYAPQMLTKAYLAYGENLFNKTINFAAQQELIPKPVVPLAVPQEAPVASTVPTQAESQGALFLEHAVKAGIKLAEKAYFKVVGFSPEAVAETTKKNIEELNQWSGSEEFSKFIQATLPLASKRIYNEIKKSGGRYGGALEVEEQNIQLIIESTLINIIRNWALKSNSVEEMMGSLVKIINESPTNELPQKLNELLLPNGKKDILAPYPINDVLYKVFQDLLISKDLVDTIAVFDTTQEEAELKQTAKGAKLLEYINEFRNAGIDFTTQFASPAEAKDFIKKYLPDLDDDTLNWVAREYETISKSEGFKPVLKFAMKALEAALIRTSNNIVTNGKGQDVMNLVVKFGATHFEELLELKKLNGPAKEKRIREIFTPFSQELLKLFDLSNSPGFFKFFMPMLSENLPMILGTAYLKQGEKALNEALQWEEMKDKNAKEIGPKGSLLAQKLGKFAAKEAFAALKLEKVVPEGALDSAEPATAVLSSGFGAYLNTVFLKVFADLQKRVAQKETEPGFDLKLKVQLINLLKNYMVSKRDATLFEEQPTTKQLTLELFKLVGITKETLPVPEVMKEKIWTLLTQEVFPSIIKKVADSYINFPYLETKLLEQLQDYKSGKFVSTYKTDPTFENACGGLLEEMSKFLDMTLINTTLKTKVFTPEINHVFARYIHDLLTGWTVSHFLKEGIAAASEIDYNAEAKPLDYKPKALPKLIGEVICNELNTTIKNNFEWFWSKSYYVFVRVISDLCGALGFSVSASLTAFFDRIGKFVWFCIGWIPLGLKIIFFDWYIKRKTYKAFDKLRVEVGKDLAARAADVILRELNE